MAQWADITPGFALRELRKNHYLSQRELAERCGLDQATISALENGTKSIGIERAKRLAMALSVHPAVIAFPGWSHPT